MIWLAVMQPCLPWTEADHQTPLTAAARAAADCAAGDFYRAPQTRTHVKFIGDSICLYGRLDRDFDFSAVIASIRSGRRGHLVVRSGGGDVSRGLEIGEAVAASQVTVVVDGFCISSCANWLFLGAPKKVVLPHSVVLWHGGPVMFPGLTDESKALVRRSDQFFSALGIDASIVTRPPIAEGWSERVAARPPGQNAGWTAGPKMLLLRYRVSGILSMWWDRDEIAAMLTRNGFMFPPLPDE